MPKSLASGHTSQSAGLFAGHRLVLALLLACFARQSTCLSVSLHPSDVDDSSVLDSDGAWSRLKGAGSHFRQRELLGMRQQPPSPPPPPSPTPPLRRHRRRSPSPPPSDIEARQSNAVGENMQGSRPACCSPVPGKLLTFNLGNNPTNQWRDATPCVGCISRGANPAFYDSCGPDLGFGRVLLQLGVSGRVGFVPTAAGGTNLADMWCPGCPLYKDMAQTVVRAMRAAGPNARLRGMLWVQGESDANNDWNAAAYGARFAAFLAAEVRDQQLSFNGTNVLKVDMANYGFYLQSMRNPYQPDQQQQ
eukprot:XP_001692425.1 predicted protein [Chlamydomonas reinhardtii]